MAELTGSEILELLQKVLDENKQANKEMIKDLAFQISHPAPTEAEVKASKNLWEARTEMAKIESSSKAHKRAECTGQSDKPHHRASDPLVEGALAGRSLVYWHLTQYSSRNEAGRLCLSAPTPIGICIRCHTTWQPEDEDYTQAMSWGMNTQVTTAPINLRNGDWAEMVSTETRG